MASPSPTSDTITPRTSTASADELIQQGYEKLKEKYRKEKELVRALNEERVKLICEMEVVTSELNELKEKLEKSQADKEDNIKELKERSAGKMTMKKGIAIAAAGSVVGGLFVAGLFGLHHLYARKH